MALRTQQFVDNWLKKGRYEYDESVRAWAGWIEGLPGVYAQADEIEEVREELAELVEEYLISELQAGRAAPGFHGNTEAS